MSFMADDQGYDANFEPELEKKYTCPICLAALRDPVQTKCGHRFCGHCLKRSFGNMRFSRCPVDKTWFDTIRDVFVDNAMRREVLSLTVKCEKCEEGCSWQGELSCLKTHMMSCPAALTTCPNACGVEIARKEIDCHLLLCPHRMEPCFYCKTEFVLSEMTKHQVLNCEKFPVNCGVCGENGIVREDITRHLDELEGDCALVTVRCIFAGFGCNHTDKRKNMIQHYREWVHFHLILMARSVAEQAEAVTEVKQIAMGLNQKIEGLHALLRTAHQTTQHPL